MKNIYKHICLLLMFSYLGAYAQTEPEVILLENDVAIINYYNNDGNLLQSEYVENYSDRNLDNFTGESGSVEFGDEELLDIVSFPESGKSIRPSIYCYNPTYHKYYIYGSNKVIVYNSLNNNLITDVVISESTQLQTWAYPNLKPMVFNESLNKLYCLTPDNTLVIIDGVNDEIEGTIDLGVYYQHIFKSIYLNENSNHLYITQVLFNGEDFSHTKLMKYTATGDLLMEQDFSQRIRDIECITNNKLYLSCNVGIYKVNANDFSELELINSGFYTDMSFAKSENKIYASNTNTIDVINTINDQIFTSIESNLVSIFNETYNPIDKKSYLIGRNIYNEDCIVIVSTEWDYEIKYSTGFSPRGVKWFSYAPDKVYVRGKGNLFFYWADTDQFGNSLNQGGGYGRHIGFNPDLNQVISSNKTAGYLRIHDENIYSTLKTEQTGGWCNYVVYNPTNDKVYIIDRNRPDDFATLSIYNGTDNSLIENILIGLNPRNIIYLEETNKIFVLQRDGYIKVINGVTNVVEDVLYIGSLNATNILESNNNYLVAASFGAEDKIIMFNHSNYNQSEMDISTGTPIKMIWGEGGYSYLNSKTSSSSNYLSRLKIPYNEEWILERDINDFLEYSPIDTTVFTLINNKVTKVDGKSGDVLKQYDLSNMVLLRSIYYPKENALILLVRKPATGNLVLKLSCDELEVTASSDILPTATYDNFYLNKTNDRLYLYMEKAGSDLQTKLLAFNTNELSLISSINLGPKFSLNERKGAPGLEEIYMDLNTNTNQLLVPNSIFSNFSVVQCPEEERTFKNGWNWVSFPKLERTDDDPVDLAPLLNTLEPMPSQMLVQHRLNTEGNPMTDALYDEDIGQWTFNNLNDLQSTKGYKIEITDGDDEFQLTTPGNRLDPAHPIMLAGDMVENWIGYYEYQSASDPFEALAFCLDNLRVIKMQNWSAFYEVIGIDKGIPIYGWISVKPRPVKYGDMMIVQGINDCELIWNQIPKPGGKDLAEASYFEYEEQADYTSVFIVLDENTDVDEIGAFVGETCVGATVVEEGDEMVEIQAYLQGAEGDEMYFETYSPNKSAPTRPSEYFVKDFNTQQYVNRKIRPYDKKPFHLVSFKDKSTETATDLLVYHYPNPAKDEVNIHFNIVTAENVNIELMDINGKLIDKVDLGHYPLGTYDYTYKIPLNLSKGVYFYKFITENTTFVNQLVIQ